MKIKTFRILVLALAGFSMVACSSPAKMAKFPELVSASCNPPVLEVVADVINAQYTLAFPEGYFHPKAILEVVPVLVYKGGETAAPIFKLQGEKINDNHIVIPAAGGSASHAIQFAYKPGMEASHLELRLTVLDKTKRFDYPAPYKVADGANITYKLVSMDGTPALAPHKYQKIIAEQKEAQIMYLVNNATVRPKELTKNEIKEFEKFLADAAKDERRTITGTNIIAYASPEGPEKLNDKLSAGREKSALDAFNKATKKIETGAPVNTQSIGEDWAGFQELVSKTNIADKDLILRVLSMYSDSNVREREIKNMSMVYTTLSEKVLPELRRARWIANVDFANYTDDELVDLLKNQIDLLDEEALLYVGTLVRDNNEKIKAYKQAATKFNSARGYNNLAVSYLNGNNVADAKAALAKIAQQDAYAKNNLGVIALRENKYAEANTLFAQSGLPEAKYNMGALDIYNGKYNDAVSKLAGSGDHNEAIAYILTNQLNKVDLKCKCAHGSYIRAVVAARKGDKAAWAKEMETVNTDATMKARAENDIEFAKMR